MRYKLFPVVLAGAILLGANLGCSAPGLLAPITPAPETPPTPQVLVVVATPTPGPPAESAMTLEAQRIAVYEHAAPAVVNITTQVLRTSFFYGTIPEEGSGSGFLWDAQGHIVTNHHVIAGAQKIEVSFSGDFTTLATVIGSDPVNDLAVLRVESIPPDSAPLTVGSSAQLKVGQTAIVLGNPFGRFERTMTVGIISALNRTIQTDSAVLRGVIQTDAAINRGNSGGPLLDLRGRLIGVNSAIYSPTGASAGVGLAIPVDKVQLVVPVLIRDGRYPHPWLGVEELGYELTPALAKALRLPVERGLLVARLYRNSPADQAGLRIAQREVVVGNRRYQTGGDIITEVDGRPVVTWEKLGAYLDEECTVGQTITLTIFRDGTKMTVTAQLQDTPESLRTG
ncbi:MAG: Peptidase [Chloroflexota bacterium]|nr:Peptidase [Chloroflexota bacterium]